MLCSLVTLIAIVMSCKNSPEAMSVRKAYVTGYTPIGLFQGVEKNVLKEYLVRITEKGHSYSNRFFCPKGLNIAFRI